MPRVTTVDGKVIDVYTKKQVRRRIKKATESDTDPTPPPPPPPPPPEFVPAYPGQPQPEFTYWGASIGVTPDGKATQYNGPASRHEGPTGLTLGIRRRFVSSWSSRNTLISWTKEDHGAGRLPWVSVKTPGWKEMASGSRDSEIKSVLSGIEAAAAEKALPVWLTFFHEPEDNSNAESGSSGMGDPADHFQMNKHIRALMTQLGTKHIALAPVYMCYTFNEKDSGRKPNDWFQPGVYDFIGIDVYNPSATNGDNLFEMFQWTEMYDKVVNEWGLQIAVGEWGMKGTNISIADRIEDWWDEISMDENVVGACVYDSPGGARGPWILEGEALAMFQEMMAEPEVAYI